MSAVAAPRQPTWPWVAGGFISILFGLAAIFWPRETLAILVWIFAAFVIIDGIAAIVYMFYQMNAHRTWWPSLLLGIVDIAIGAFILANPSTAATILVYIIGFWAIFLGMLEILLSLMAGEFLMLIVGVLSIMFGFILLANPTSSALALVVVIGVFAIVRGIILLWHAFAPPETPPADVSSWS
jgi:uncharacterized membrane protein HdeD (DUF308 family)